MAVCESVRACVCVCVCVCVCEHAHLSVRFERFQPEVGRKAK